MTIGHIIKRDIDLPHQGCVGNNKTCPKLATRGVRVRLGAMKDLPCILMELPECGDKCGDSVEVVVLPLCHWICAVMVGVGHQSKDVVFALPFTPSIRQPQEGCLCQIVIALLIFGCQRIERRSMLQGNLQAQHQQMLAKYRSWHGGK